MPKKKTKFRLILEFETTKEMAQFVDELWDLRPSEKQFAAYKCDVLDTIEVNDRTYFLRHVGERPESYRLK